MTSNTTSNELLSLLMAGVSSCGLWKQNGLAQLPVKKVLQLTSQMLPTICPSLEAPCVEFVYSVLQLATKQDVSPSSNVI